MAEYKTINDVSNVTTDPVNEDKLLLWNNLREKTTKITFEDLLKYEQKKNLSTPINIDGQTQSTVENALNALNVFINTVAGAGAYVSAAAMHRNIFRGRCLNGDKNTLYPTTPFPDAPKFTGLGYSTAEVLAMITDGSFRDIWTGDYFIDFNDNNRVYRIVDLDAYYNRGNRTVVNKHHIVVVPDYAMDNTPWNSSGNTNGGYPSSTIRSVMEGASVQGKIESFFGSSNLIPMEALLPTGESDWAWSQDFSGWTPKTLPMTEVEVYGSSVFGNGFQTGTGCSQLAGFKLEPRLAVGMRYDYWLMSIVSSSHVCLVYVAGVATSVDVPRSLGCRPRVLIG